jgi:hypothetical protein
MYNFVFNHDDKFWIFLTIKDVQNQNQQHSLKGFNTCALFKKHMLPFLWSILEPIINLRTFDESLNNKKYVPILKSLKKSCQQVLCVWQRTLIT